MALLEIPMVRMGVWLARHMRICDVDRERLSGREA